MSADQDPRDDAEDRDPDAGDATSSDPAAGDAGKAEEPDETEEPGEDGEEAAEVAPGGRPAWRTPVFATGRGVIVAVIAVVGYFFVVPQTHVNRSRMARLVVPETGIAAFPGKAAQSQSEPVATSGIKSLAAVSKSHPDATGIWVSQWNGSGQTASDGAAVVVFVAPTPADAAKALGDLRPQTVDAKTSNQSFSRSQTFATQGIPGSVGALFTNSQAQAGQPSRLASILWQQGKVVGLVEQIADVGTEQQAESLAQREEARLRSEEPGFSQKVTTYPTGWTIAWAAVAAVVVVIVVMGPVLLGRTRRRRAAQRQAILDGQVRGHSAIAKRRRAVGSPGSGRR